MKTKMRLVASDNPWMFDDQLNHSDIARGASSNYPVLDLEALKQLPIKDITDPTGSLLALWVPSSLLTEGLQVMEAWGFALKQSWIWVKTKLDPIAKLKTINDFNDKENSPMTFGMGRIARNCHELVLIGIRGKIYEALEDRSQRTVFFAPNLKHSQKPDILQDRFESMFPSWKEDTRLELFARRQKPGWRCVGNELSGKDIREELAEIIAE